MLGEKWSNQGVLAERHFDNDSLCRTPKIAFQTILLLYSLFDNTVLRHRHSALKCHEMTNTNLY